MSYFKGMSKNNYSVHSQFSFSSQTLTEDVISVLLQLLEDEQVKQGGSPKVSTDPLSVQVAACIIALCGWAARYKSNQ